MFVAQELAETYGDKRVQSHLGKKSMDELFSYEHSGKLLGLVEMLTECEIIQHGEPHEPKAEEGA